MFEALTKYLPKLQATDFSAGNGGPTADEFRKAIDSFVGRHWELGLSDAIGILRRAGLWNDTSSLDARLPSLDGRTVAALVAYAARKDRLCAGAFLECLSSGQMAQWLARLRAIDEAGEDAVAAETDEAFSRRASMAQAILLGLACGDALGVPVEFLQRGTFKVDKMEGWGTHVQAPGTWSDDTSLALAFAMSLVPGGFNALSAGRNFQAWYYDRAFTPHGEVFDVGSATSKAIYRMQTVVSPELAGGMDERDNGNGSLMRIAPLALSLLDVPEPAARYEWVRKASSMTHAHPLSCACCFVFIEYLLLLAGGLAREEAYRKLCADFAKDCSFIGDDIPARLSRVLDAGLASLPESEIHSDGFVLHTLEASLWCLLTTASFPEAVLKAVNLGDDSDTTGAVTGAMAGLAYGVEGIPAEWIAGLVKLREIKFIALGAAKACLSKSG
ncbi:MAG: ADP-ribosylglycohydrolase family protein [Desulfovibrio sp.]|nr:ADP-ribosylglycohydrolase family protein [Desulfovibrio sp.]